MNELKIFNSPEFGQVRTFDKGGEPWFVGKDVATILGYERTADAIRAHVDDDDKGVGEIQTPGGKQKDGKPMFSRYMVYRMARRKEIPSMKIGRRVLFSDKALDQWIAEQNVIPIQE